jgi:hypothetical protein
MSGPFGSSQWMYASGGFYPYQIEQSLRFNDDDSAYLSRTPASAGNRKTWTWSGWVKRCDFGTNRPIWSAYTDANNRDIFQWDSARLQYVNISGGSANTNLNTTALFRDTSAWYHVVLAVDTTQATSTNRIKIYVNGTQQTDFIASTYPSQNTDMMTNNNVASYLGREVNGGQYADNYLAEVNFIDGTALDPTSFGETKSGIWVPKAYSGAYGTNGFYLSFADSAAIGDDLSGNGNDWTANNLVSTDVLLDSPTENYAVLNPLDKYSTVALSEGNLSFSISEAAYRKVRSSMGMSSGKWYCEVFGSSDTVGICSANVALSTSVGQDASGYGYIVNGNKFNNNVQSSYGASWNNTNIIGIAYDADAGSLTFYKDGASQGTAFTSITEEMFFAISAYNLSSGGIFNFGQDSSFAGNKTRQGNTDDNGVGDFYYAPPSGFLALCTANLPDPVIDPAQDDVPADYFNTVLYTGTGATQSITGVGFQPDWVWFKRRGAVENHWLTDAVRGSTKGLFSNLTDAEATRTDQLTSFDADGFSLGADAAGYTNISGQSYVAWNWLAGNGTASNTDGSITSTVSVNQKAGFSVVTGTAPASAVAFTTGHGLGVSPAMIINKTRSGTAYNWWTWHKALSNAAQSYIGLNLTSAAGTDVSLWANTAPTSTVWSMTSGNYPATSQDFVSYCFAEVEGYSKFGSYAGNGSTDGPFVYCGFRPAWVLIKSSTQAYEWVLHDTARDPFNFADNSIFPNDATAEAVNGAPNSIDILSNGFKIRANWTRLNDIGGTYIFMAFAESPFKYANAR